jgi:hypothetical protein
MRSDEAPVVAFVARSAISPPVSPAKASFFAADVPGSAEALDALDLLSALSWPG